MSVVGPDSDSLRQASRAWPLANNPSAQNRTQNGAPSSIAKSPGKVLRPLLIAEAANPEWTSVPLVGWNLAHAIMQRTNALLVTQVRNRDALLRAGLVEERDFIAIDNERVARAFYRLSERLRGGENKGWTVVTALSSFSYYSFEREVWRLLGKRLMDGEFDLVHRITPLSPTSQSPIARKLKNTASRSCSGRLMAACRGRKVFRTCEAASANGSRQSGSSIS